MLIITSAMAHFSPGHCTVFTVFASLCYWRHDVIVITNCYCQPQTNSAHSEQNNKFSERESSLLGVDILSLRLWVCYTLQCNTRLLLGEGREGRDHSQDWQ